MSEYGLDPKQFRDHIIRPTLVKISLHSLAAEQLVLGTCLHESHLRYVKQIRGPAMGFAQMEPATHVDLHRNFLAYNQNLRREVVKLASFFSAEYPDPGEMMFNAAYAIAMCRVHYRRVKAPLPAAGDALGMARYWSQHYNTPLGKGTVEQALPHFAFAVNLETSP